VSAVVAGIATFSFWHVQEQQQHKAERGIGDSIFWIRAQLCRANGFSLTSTEKQNEDRQENLTFVANGLMG
jgi:hypothetical protein